jgi:transcriptional regulator with AAA-type ATPase domain
MERATQVIGQSGAFLDALERASRAAALDRPVLVIGERGTGKELVAERLHRLSPRWDQPLVIMNCAALPETLIEAELFGHESGAFTGATKARAGRFEEAHRGTLFLDELGTLSMAAQDRLLRAVEYGEVTRIGRDEPTRVTSPYSTARSNRSCAPIDSVASSSRNRVPPSASSNRPARTLVAPVNAPASCPNNSASISVSGSAAQFITTSG